MPLFNSKLLKNYDHFTRNTITRFLSIGLVLFDFIFELCEIAFGRVDPCNNCFQCLLQRCDLFLTIFYGLSMLLNPFLKFLFCVVGELLVNCCGLSVAAAMAVAAAAAVGGSAVVAAG
jgi:hypothetical protein